MSNHEQAMPHASHDAIDALNGLGWGPFFQGQITEPKAGQPARVVGQHRRKLEVQTASERIVVSTRAGLPPITVGDWVLVGESGSISRVLERRSCFRRKAPGAAVDEQVLAANVDVAFIVCSLNEDFSLNRIERYLSVAHDARATPVVVLTKVDQCADPAAPIREVRGLGSDLCIEPVNGLDAASASVLLSWFDAGTTAVLLGSSGAGKSTLTNALMGAKVQTTGAIREADAKGRHTTTRRSMLMLPNGGLIIDTPGIRELQLSECESGVAKTFADIEQASASCRFTDCAHQTEPGCAVIQQIEQGVIEARRLDNYRTLLREQAVNAQSVADRRAREKSTSRSYKKHQRAGRRFKKGED